MSSTPHSVAVPILEVQDLTLLRGKQKVLDSVSFSIQAGSFVAVLGGNGAGKTSLFRVILGLESLKTGQVRVLGQEVKPGKASIGYMPQMRELVAGQFKGWNMVAAAFRGGVCGLPWYNQMCCAQVNAALAAVDALDLAHRPIATLSGGQQQRLMLAQAFLDDPRLLLLDEPLASLDHARRRDTVQRIYTYARTKEMTVLLSTHDMTPLQGFIDYILYLVDGRALLGRVEEVMTAQALTALYGTPVEVVQAGGHLFVVTKEGGDTLHSCACVG